MQDALDSANATWEGGVVRYPDAAAVRADLDGYLRKHVLRVRGSQVPAFLAEVAIGLCLPGCSPLRLRAQVISATPPTALLHVLDWSAEVETAVRVASASTLAGAAPSAGPPRPPSVAPTRAPDPGARHAAPATRAPIPSAPPGTVLGAMRPSGVRLRAPIPSGAPGGAPPPPSRPAPARSSPRELLPRPVAAADVRRLHETLACGTWFEVLGVHYSDPPSEIDAAYAAMKRALAPGSEAQVVSPELAEKLVALADQAWTVVGERAARRAYRQALGIDHEQAAELKAARADLEALRGETENACALFEAAIDLYPRRHYIEGLRALRRGTPESVSPESVELVRPARPRSAPSPGSGGERLSTSTWSLRQARR